MFRKVLVANRGEIAVRVIRALRELGIGSVAVYSEADRGSLHVRMADEAACIGPAPSAESYLAIGKILDAARKHGAGAIHPGYGFLSENSAFAAACEAAGIPFIGPSARTIAAMGSKTAAREIAVAAGVPVVPGGVAADARRIGFPLMVKAAAGGGGKGMRAVRTEAELDAAMRDASSEAAKAFGSGEVYVEKLIEKPRHIEVQVFGDHHGNLIHLGERECSVQRRHQKVIEECPSPFVDASLRERMGAAAVRAAKAAGYFNAGTVEFLVDADGGFYFLEMNTRLQVEHPVTELVTGVDCVHWQLLVASGVPLPLRQDQVTMSGAAMECRIYAEDPANNFFPSPGKITHVAAPSGPGVRWDCGVYRGWNVPLEYDPLLAKLAVWAGDRSAAIARMRRALLETEVSGIRTNIEFFRGLLADSEFHAGRLHTGFIEEYSTRAVQRDAHSEAELAAAIAAALSKRDSRVNTANTSTGSAWLHEGRSRLLR